MQHKTKTIHFIIGIRKLPNPYTVISVTFTIVQLKVYIIINTNLLTRSLHLNKTISMGKSPKLPKHPPFRNTRKIRRKHKNFPNNLIWFYLRTMYQYFYKINTIHPGLLKKIKTLTRPETKQPKFQNKTQKPNHKLDDKIQKATMVIERKTFGKNNENSRLSFQNFVITQCTGKLTILSTCKDLTSPIA